jgi:hypothetical protein
MALSVVATQTSVVIIEGMNRFQCGPRSVFRAVFKKEKGSAMAQPAE